MTGTLVGPGRGAGRGQMSWAVGRVLLRLGLEGTGAEGSGQKAHVTLAHICHPRVAPLPLLAPHVFALFTFKGHSFEIRCNREVDREKTQPAWRDSERNTHLPKERFTKNYCRGQDFGNEYE